MAENDQVYEVPPHDTEAEGKVLAACMVDPYALPVVAELLRPAQCYAEAHRWMLEGMLALYAAGKPTDAVHLGGWLNDCGRLQQLDKGLGYLMEVLAVGAPTNVRPYAMRVEALWRLRELQARARAALAGSYGAGQEASAYCERTAQAFHELAYLPGSTGELEPLKGPLTAAFARIQEAAAAGRTLLGYATGLERLDRMTGGLHAGELFILAARPGKGKSSAALQWAVAVAEAGHTVPFFSLEMPKDQLAMRAACLVAGVDVSRWRLGALTPADWAKLAPAVAHVAALPLYVDDTAGLTVMGLRARLRRLVAECARAKRPAPAVCMVDYLQLVHATPGAARQGREREVAEVAQQLKEVAKEFAMSVVAPCQMNRAIEQGGRRPRLSDLRESGNIEQAADAVCFIHEAEGDWDVYEFVVEKQRNGPTCVIKALFSKQYTRFDNLVDGEYEVRHG